MKSVEFTEEQLSDLGSLKDMLFADENDPRSTAYKRKLIRPKINWLRVVIFSLIPIITAVLIAVLFKFFEIPPLWTLLCEAAFLLIYLALFAKKGVICMVRIYQRFAPANIREKCRFEPSCSQYMILAIEKYGLLKGVGKGINRIRRCKSPNGGYDMP